MIKKLGTAKLLGILVVLVLIYLGFEFFGGKSRSKNFHEVLVAIDTAKVDKILIDKGGKELELVKKNEDWNVNIGDNKFAEATPASVKGTMNTLASIKASRIVSKSPDKWKDYQVDSAGTRVKIFQGDKKAVDIIIGRFGFKSQREYSTYVRLADEDEVYAAENFMGMAIGTEAARYRNSKVVNLNKDSLAAISFNYPDSSFTLTKDSTSWKIGNAATDSAATAQFVNNLAHLNSSSFYDKVAPSGTPVLSVTVKRKSKEDIEIKAWDAGNQKWIVNSSENPESYFSDESLSEKLFKGRSYFSGKGD